MANRPRPRQDAGADSPSALRASMMAAAGETADPSRTLIGRDDPGVTSEPGSLPTAEELLDASPNVRRLCANYHASYRRIAGRNRRQRLGIAILVAVISVVSVAFYRSGRLDPATARLLVISAAGASGLGVIILGLLWMRESHGLSNAQGERMLRALQFNSSLPEERIRAFRHRAQPSAAFFECYTLWREENRQHGLGAVLSAFGGKKQRLSAD